MSRSYKKFAVFKDRAKTSKERFKPKTYANRAVRRSETLPGGKSGFKKMYCSWIISDYRILDYPDERELKRAWDNNEPHLHKCYKNYREAFWDWKKSFIRK